MQTDWQTDKREIGRQKGNKQQTDGQTTDRKVDRFPLHGQTNKRLTDMMTYNRQTKIDTEDRQT